MSWKRLCEVMSDSNLQSYPRHDLLFHRFLQFHICVIPVPDHSSGVAMILHWRVMRICIYIYIYIYIYICIYIYIYIHTYIL